MSRSKTTMLLVLALLATLSLGCGLIDSLTKKATEKGAEIVEQGQATLEAVATEAVPEEAGSSDAPEATKPPEEPTQAAEATEAPAEDVADLSTLADFDALDSYRMTVAMTWKQVTKDGVTEEGAMEMLEEYDRASNARRFRISGTMPDAAGVATSGSGEMEMIQIGNASYVGSDGEWVTMQSGEEDAADQVGWVTDPAEFAGGQGTFVGNENVNGVSAKHYHYKESGVGGVGLGLGQMDEVEADVWVSEEHNVVVKVANTWNGTDAEGTEYSGTVNVDVVDINQPVVIEAPEGVEPPGMPEDVPLMDGASNVESMMGMNTFDVPATVDEVVAFYDEAMAANGWEVGDDSIPGMRTYTKGSRQATLMPEETDEGCSVTLMITEE